MKTQESREMSQERVATKVTLSVLKNEPTPQKDILSLLFGQITADVDFLKPNLVYKFFYSVVENKVDYTHVLYMEKLDGVARTKEHKELLCGKRSVELFSFRPDLIQFLVERALNQMTNKGVNTLLFKNMIGIISDWFKETRTDSFVITTDAVRQQEQPLEIAIYGFYGPTKYL